jgi:PBP1b-binding outer membrane lipoprotein LpoB
MKKSVVIVVLLTVVLGSCSQYTCPTYSRAADNKPPAERKI